MIKGLYNGHIWLVDELRKTVKKTVDCNRGLYIHSVWLSQGLTCTKKYMKRH